LKPRENKDLNSMGAVGLEPTRPFKVNGFSSSRSFRYCCWTSICPASFENWTLPLPSP